MKTPSWQYGPNDDIPSPSKLTESVLELLVAAGCPDDTCEQVSRLIEAWEHTLVEPEPVDDYADFGPYPEDFPVDAQ